MKYLRVLSALYSCLLAAGPALAEPPRVVTDIPPVHSLASRVMEGLAEPDLLLSGGASPHNSSLRPSQARSLQNAELVFWMGPGLAPWLENPIQTLAVQAEVLNLSGVPGTVLQELEDDHDHDDGHGHGSDDHDPHAWLDPANAQLWMGAMAEVLANLDRENAGRYRENARSAITEIESLADEIETLIAPIRGRPYLVEHDAWRSFAARFNIPALAALTASDDAKPGASHVSELRQMLTSGTVACILASPQQRHGIVATLIEGTDARLSQLDPAGMEIKPGPSLYSELLLKTATELATCLGAGD